MISHESYGNNSHRATVNLDNILIFSEWQLISGDLNSNTGDEIRYGQMSGMLSPLEPVLVTCNNPLIISDPLLPSEPIKDSLYCD